MRSLVKGGTPYQDVKSWQSAATHGHPWRPLVAHAQPLVQGDCSGDPHAVNHTLQSVLLEGLEGCAEAVTIHRRCVRADLMRKVAAQALLPGALRPHIRPGPQRLWFQLGMHPSMSWLRSRLSCMHAHHVLAPSL